MGKAASRAFRLLLVTVATGLTMFAGASGLGSPSTAVARAADPRVDELATLINRARVARGLLPLARSTELDAAADVQSRDMAANNYLDHQAPDGSTPQDRAARAGYRVPPQSGWIVVEVISAISGEPRGPLDWWLNESPEVHGKVVLNPRWREMGVGYAAGGEYGNYWTVLFGCRPTVVPMVVLDGVTYRHTETCGDPTALGPEWSAAPAIAAASPAALPSVAVRFAPPASGPGLEIAWTGIPSPSERDWYGLYQPGAADTDYLDWSYVSCAWLPLSARAAGSCWLPLRPLAASGEYEARLFAGNGYTRLAMSSPITLSTR